jgi:hypothetical protein
MSRILTLLLLMLPGFATMQAAPRAHTVSLGAAASVKLFLGPADGKSVEIRVRPLYVDGRLKEFTTGELHDITEQIFAIQRAYRVNDSLPEDPRGLPKWKWQRGGWVLVDRRSGRVAPLRLPDFDPFYSTARWYRDYVAYCGISDSGEKLYAVVTQVGRKKPLLHKDLGQASEGELPDANCAAPHWERQPARVTFLPYTGQKLTFDVHGRPADLAPPEPASAEEESN